jgi:hypothetical protein
VSDKKELQDEVGYRRPPRQSQFRKGKSGNPVGRPKGSRNRTTLLEDALRETVMVNENGERKQISKGEAILKQLVNKAAGGDARSAQMILGEIRAIDSRQPESRDQDDRDGVQMLMLERLTVAERLELRRLVAKAQGDLEPADVTDPVEVSSESDTEEVRDPDGE